MECIVYLAGVACHFLSGGLLQMICLTQGGAISERLCLQNFLLIEEVLLQDVKFGIWCDVSAAMTLGLSFSPPPPQTINSQQYVTHIYSLL
jgi:hypothetical protein